MTDGRAQTLARLRERIVAFAACRFSREGAEDLAQEVLMVIHERYAHLDRPEDLVPLAFQILRYKAMAWRRKQARRGEHVEAREDALASPAPGPQDQAERQELLGRLLAGIQRMDARCRELFGHKLKGRTFPEIQGLMGAGTLNTVYTWDHRCRQRLLAGMGGRWTP